MINLLRSELYKLGKSKSYKVAAVLSVLFVLICYRLISIMQTDEAGSAVPATAEAVRNMLESTIMYNIQNMFANTNAIIFATIFICIFVLNDYSSGAIKNLVGKGYRREKVYLAKFLVTGLGAVVLYLIVAVSVLITGIICYRPEQLTGAFWADFGSYFALHILYLTGYTAIIVFVCAMARSMAVGVLVSILGIMIFSDPLLSAIDYFLHTWGADFGISQYWIMTVMSNCPATDIPSKFAVQSIIIAGAWLAAAMTGGMVFFARRDI